jgi:hypothetical protein
VADASSRIRSIRSRFDILLGMGHKGTGRARL